MKQHMFCAIKFINGDYQPVFEYADFDIARSGNPDSTYIFILPDDGDEFDRRVIFPIANVQQMNTWAKE